MKSSRSSFMRPCLRKKEKGEERRGGERRGEKEGKRGEEEKHVRKINTARPRLARP